jgi:hypothetical protein
MMALVMETPAFFQNELEELSFWWNHEKVQAWDAFDGRERMQEVGRRFDVVSALRDQYAWRVCVLCRTYIDGMDQLHLNRPCGHQCHEQCLRQWSAATATPEEGTRCPQGCGYQMTLFKAEGGGKLMPAVSTPFGAGGKGGISNLMCPVGSFPPPVRSWMPQLWIRGRPAKFPNPMRVSAEDHRSDWD